MQKHSRAPFLTLVFKGVSLVKKLNLAVIEQVPVHLSTFGNDTTLHFLDLVKIKVQMGKRCRLFLLNCLFVTVLQWDI